jgi:hypothetical protein
MSLRRVDTHVFSTTLELTGKKLELTGIAVTERSRSAHCDDLTMSFGIRHVFSKPAVASSFDFSKSNFEVLELT